MGARLSASEVTTGGWSGTVCAAVKRQRESLRNLPKTVEELFTTLERGPKRPTLPYPTFEPRATAMLYDGLEWRQA